MPIPIESSEFAGSELAGAVSVLYDDPTSSRFELSLDNAERYQAAGLPLVVVDASPEHVQGTWVADAHRQRGAIVLPVPEGQGGIAKQRMQGVRYAVAHGAQKVVGHESEKNLMITFADKISAGLDEADILVIGRTEAAEASLPPVQRQTERFAGWILEETLRLPPDTLSGGRGFTVAGAEILQDYPADEPGMNNWIYLYETLLRARAQGMNIGGIKVDLMHPGSMVAEETGNETFDRKRYDQFTLQLDYLLDRPEVTPTGRKLAEVVKLGLGLLGDRPLRQVAHNFSVVERVAENNYGYQSADSAA